MKKLDIKKGMRFGKLVILKEVAPYTAHYKNRTQQLRQFLCQCSCGNELNVTLASLRTENTTSCGCLRNEMTIKRSTTHGKTGTREYGVWRNMRNRCNLKTDASYKYYGGRGIKVCERWEKFANFWTDMKDGYKTDLTLDRIDNNKGYYKENCRWATYEQQENNRRDNVFIKYNGKW